MTGPCMHSFLSIIGTLSVAEDGYGNIIRVYLPCSNLDPMEQHPSEVLLEAEAEIDEFLSGRRKGFDLPISYSGTEFFMDVMDAIEGIPYGEIRSYKAVAETAGHPNAFRAVGTACSNNPLPIIVPCHRVLPSSGDVGRYAGGSSIKRQLLRIEGSLRADITDQTLDLVRVG